MGVGGWGQARALVGPVILAVLAGAGPVAAASFPVPALPLEPFGAREGLPAGSINAFLVDRSGLLWIASKEGLYAYDGYRFTGYQHDLDDPASLVDNWVRVLFEDRTGTLWVGTNSGGLARLDRASGRFRTWRHESGNPATLSHDSVYAIAEAGEGALWVGTQSGLNRLDLASGRIARVRLLPETDALSGREYVAALLPEPDGALWVATVGTSLLRFDPRTGVSTALAADEFDPAALPSGDVFALARDATGTLWAGTRRGLVTIAHADHRIRRIVTDPVEALITTLAASKDGIVAGAFEGVYRARGPDRAERIPVELAKQVTAVAVDSAGSLWIGTAGQGCFRLLPPALPFRALRAGPQPSGSLVGDDVNAILEDHGGNLWIGAFEGTLTRRRAGTETFEEIPFAKGLLEPPYGILDLAEDASGGIWVATSRGIVRLDPRTRRAALYQHDPKDPESLGRGYVLAVLCDVAGRVWVGTGGGGLHRLKPEGKGFEHFLVDADDPATPSEDYVTVLLQDREGRIWEGTRSGGLNLIDAATGRAQRIPVDPADPGAIAHHSITAILEDRQGRLWFGTGGGGIARLAGIDPVKGPRFERVTSREGLAADNVMGLAEDDDGSLWVSTRRGLSRYDPARRTCVSFDTADGLPSAEGNRSAALGGRTAIWIGTPNGLIEIPRGTPFPAPGPARLAMTAVRTLKGPAAPAGAPWPPERIEIHHGEALSVEMAVVDYDPHRRHRYEYRLGEKDLEWRDLGGRHELTFTDLAPGEHRLQLRGRGARDEWSAPLAVTVKVIPPFYRTAWFRLVAVLSLAAAVFTGHRLRTVSLERRNRELLVLQGQREAALQEAREAERDLRSAFEELGRLTRRLEAAKEEERMRIARELHDEMGQLLTAAKINVQLVQRAGAAAPPKRMGDTIALIDRMIQLVRELSFDLRPPLLDELGLAGALRDHVEAQALRGGLSASFRDEGLPDRLPAELEIAAFRIVQEAMTNVLRHAGAHHVDVALGAKNGTIRIDVQDDGAGFDAFRRDGAGLNRVGLTGMMERARALGGEATITSAPGKGTRVHAALPWREEARA